MGNGRSLASIVSAFGAAAKRKLANPAASGAPEDQLRAPLETLLADLTELSGYARKGLDLVGESTLAHLSTRPDYAVTLNNALIGFIEVKAPGKGGDPRRFKDEHDKRQWEKLKALPNLLYTDGNEFGLWQEGKDAKGDKDKADEKHKLTVIRLDGDIETSGDKLAAPPSLGALIANFLGWRPLAPKSAKQLAETSARLCRLLRDEVKEELERTNPGLTSLATEWRGLLFPDASDAQFADGYAQAVTFGLLVARVHDVDLSQGLDAAANRLREQSTLIGTALRLLIDNPDIKTALATALDTLTRVLNAVSWSAIAKGDAGAWLYFYEDFLAVYDNDLRKKTGSYYTPPEVVEAMTRLVDEALRDPALFNRPKGLAAPSVTICDPAVGTGTFLLGILRRIAKTVTDDEGPGAVAGAIRAAAERIFGFELQFGPFAVAQLRLIAEVQALTGKKNGVSLPTPQLYVTDTLGDPYAKETQFSELVRAIGDSRKQANKIKRETPITVVIGNPPYKEKAKGRGGWIEKGSVLTEEQLKDDVEALIAPMNRWKAPVEWGVGAHAHHLKNLYVYFWRWASLKVFGSGWYAATGKDKEKENERNGIVCFITVAGFLNGPGFQKMREELRRDCTAIWVIDCAPEGHQPKVSTRIFQAVQQPVCIVLAARTPNKDRSVPARLKFLALPEGHREGVKFAALATLSLDGPSWTGGPSGWREPFLPELEGAWANFLPLLDFFVSSTPGVTASRTWPISPDAESLEKRWKALQREKDRAKKEVLFHSDRDRDLNTVVKIPLGPYVTRSMSVGQDRDNLVPPVRYAFRSFDRQWVAPDHRLISMARPWLWEAYSEKQIHMTCLEAHSPDSGPAISFAGLIPDKHHYKGNFSGRVYPLWRDAEASEPNVRPDLLEALSVAYGRTVAPEDMMAYLAAVMAHPAFTKRFQKDLVRPGLRVPITASAALFAKAAALGREVIWLHTYGERFADPAQGRPHGVPRLAKHGGSSPPPCGEGLGVGGIPTEVGNPPLPVPPPQGGRRRQPITAPFIPEEGAIPGAPEPLPDTMTYDGAKRRLHIGKGYVENVPQAVWDYEVSGMNVLRQWFSYRKRDRSRPIIGDRRKPSPLCDIQPDHWPHEYTSDLIDLLNVLGRLVLLEPAQATLLDEILAGPLLDRAALSTEKTLENTASGSAT